MNQQNKLYQVRLTYKENSNIYVSIYLGNSLKQAKIRMEEEVSKIVKIWKDKATYVVYRIKEREAKILIKAEGYSDCIKFLIVEI